MKNGAGQTFRPNTVIDNDTVRETMTQVCNRAVFGNAD